MSDELPAPKKQSKPPPGESDLSQVMAHAPALSQAFGPRMGAIVLIFGLSRTRYGSFGIAAIVTAMGSIAYNFLLK
jgi:hypothetical protein